MSDLVEKIRAALDEDERAAHAAIDVDGRTWKLVRDEGRAYIADDQGVYCSGNMDGYEACAAHMIRHDPARVLRQVAAMRKILDVHYEYGDGGCEGCGIRPYSDGEWAHYADDCPTLLALAEAYGIEADQ